MATIDERRIPQASACGNVNVADGHPEKRGQELKIAGIQDQRSADNNAPAAGFDAGSKNANDQSADKQDDNTSDTPSNATSGDVKTTGINDTTAPDANVSDGENVDNDDSGTNKSDNVDSAGSQNAATDDIAAQVDGTLPDGSRGISSVNLPEPKYDGDTVVVVASGANDASGVKYDASTGEIIMLSKVVNV